ncbi:VOC family protein [Aestuariimicrobium soli]|uniref:VOC family protein n=1 Tax=Aestuariimicrobium soli TaxID=2035834 RepID=UPI003EB6E368
MTLRLEAVTLDVDDVAPMSAFWADLLGREVVHDAGGELLPGDGTQVGLRFVTEPGAQIGRPQLHLHLTSADADQQQNTVSRVLALGGRHRDVGQSPDEPFVVMADPAGNELCVIEAGNRWLAGTGFLGEVTCNGGPEVGRFWSAVLGWPLVLDAEGQTAIQLPAGGTTLSWDAWDESPADEPATRSRQRFRLLSDAPAADLDRLTSLGARLIERGSDTTEWVAPGGLVFHCQLTGETWTSLAGVITYVLGAPGAGKSTVVPRLRELLSGRVVLDWDALMAPAGALAGAPIPQTPSTWDAYGRLVRAVVDLVAPAEVVLLGVCTPEELADWPHGRWVLLDCDDEVRRERLVARREPYDIEEVLVDAASYRQLGLPVIDSTHLTTDEVAAALASFVRSKL